jgi:uncharacterized protein (TIGR02145 family)
MFDQLRKNLFIVSMCLGLCHMTGFSQTDTEFWFVAPENSKNGSQNFDIPIYFRITAFDQAAQVRITQPANANFNEQLINVPAGGFATVDLSSQLEIIENKPANTILNYGLHIESTAPVSLYYEMASTYCMCNPELYSLKGRNALGTRFHVPVQNYFRNSGGYFPVPYNAIDVVATEDNTLVTITPSKEIVGHAAGVPFQVNLLKGQTYSAVATSQLIDGHLWGTLIESDKPVAVTMSDDLLYGITGCADIIGDQLIPNQVAGKEYVVVKGNLTNNGNRAFILAIEDNTAVYTDGNPLPAATLQTGQVYNHNITNPSTFISTSKPVHVLQTSGFGCELGGAVLPPVHCTGSSKVVFSRTTSQQLGVILFTKSGNEGSFLMNGDPSLIQASSFQAVPGTAGTWLASSLVFTLAQVPAGSTVNITNSTGRFHLGLMIGDVGGGCSYGYFSDFSRLNLGPDLSMCPGDSKILDAGPGWDTYLWSTGATTRTITVTTAGTYWVSTSDADCTLSDTVIISPAPGPFVTNVPSAKFICSGASTSIQLSASIPGTIFTWTTTASSSQVTGYSDGSGDVIDQTLINTSHENQAVTYTISPHSGNCTGAPFIVTVTVGGKAILTPDTTICQGTSLQLHSKSALSYQWSPAFNLSDPDSQNPVYTATASAKLYLQTQELAENLIPNGDFELGNTGFITTYTYCNTYNCLFPLADNGYSVGPDANFVHIGFSGHDNTTGTGNFMIINGAQPSLTVWKSTVPVIPNKDYAFGVWISTMAEISPAKIRFSINGVQLGPIYDAPATINQWERFYITWNSGSNTSATIEIVDVQPILYGNDFGLDDIFFGEIITCTDSLQVTATPCSTPVRLSPCFDTLTTTVGKPILLRGGWPGGGGWSGPGVNGSTGIFDPSAAGTGIHRIIYTFTNAYLHTGRDSCTITVLPATGFTCGNLLTDPRDGRTYPTVLAGTGCWMAASLDYGTPIPFLNYQADNCLAEKYCLNDLPGNCLTMGGYYQWDELMDHAPSSGNQGRCPPGWHVPTESDWNALEVSAGGNSQAATMLKSTGPSGFNATMKGNVYSEHSWYFEGFATFFWTSEVAGPGRAVAHGMNNPDPSVSEYASLRSNAFQVRCVKD